MRILVSFKLPDHLSGTLVGNNVIYRPDLEIKADREVGRALQAAAPDILITRKLPSSIEIKRWHVARGRPQGIVLISHKDHEVAVISGVRVWVIADNGPIAPELAAFRLAEELNASWLAEQATLFASQHASKPVAVGDDQQTVAMVGAGVVNLITAFYLAQSGRRISIFDGSPEPGANANWRHYGCTYGGNDARMFSLAEARHHLIQPQQALDQTECEFDRPIYEQGWNCCSAETLSARDAYWKEDYQSVPPWLPESLNDDIISFNQESAPLWEALRLSEPDLFTEIGYTAPVIRLYATQTQFEQGILFEQRIGSYVRIIDMSELIVKQPALKQAVERGAIAGAIEVVGFTINVHRFTKKLIDRLRTMGVSFSWNTRIERVARDEKNLVCGLVHRENIFRAQHYVVSPGAYGNELLKGTGSENKIASVVGMWLTLPDEDRELNSALKISRIGYAAPGAAEGANVIPGLDSAGRPLMHISTGHGYIGSNPSNLDRAHLDHLFRAVKDTAQVFFPASYARAVAEGMIEQSFRYCVRPWTPSGLGLFEQVAAENHGLLIIAAGHSTGGFAQSPSVGKAVAAALAGNFHPMHRAYHPGRLDSFIDKDQLLERQVALA